MPPRIVIVGGGLAGMAAALALSDKEVEVTLLEAKRCLGGRAGSFDDPLTTETVDHCQHVALGCCIKFLDFCRRTGIASYFRRDRTLRFLSQAGRRCDFTSSAWLPAPLHLGPAFWGLKFLSWRSRVAVARSMRALLYRSSSSSDMTTLAWLHEQRQPAEAIEQFWSIVLVSALGESLERASVRAARKVLIDGFAANREAYHLLVPTLPLGELYEQHVAPYLSGRGVKIRLSAPVSRLLDNGQRITGIELASGDTLSAEHVIIALPWRAATRVLQSSIAAFLSEPWQRIESSPITGVHLWFDRPVTDLLHAVLVGRLSQWLFARGNGDENVSAAQRHYYQVVISASRMLTGRLASDVIAEVVSDLQAVFPASHEARLLQSRVVTQPEAVFSVTPEFEALRPPQATAIPGLSLAGDWTTTGWPATMESAIRSGYLAANAATVSLGQAADDLIPDLPRAWLLPRA